MSMPYDVDYDALLSVRLPLLPSGASLIMTSSSSFPRPGSNADDDDDGIPASAGLTNYGERVVPGQPLTGKSYPLKFIDSIPGIAQDMTADAAPTSKINFAKARVQNPSYKEEEAGRKKSLRVFGGVVPPSDPHARMKLTNKFDDPVQRASL